jgi:hypothetical protein
MSSKAEIEAQIAALQARLRETIEYDPAFTPLELVRWDPSLIGTMIHIQHELDIPINPFGHTIYKDCDNKLFIFSRKGADEYNGAKVSFSRLGMCGFLTPSGLLLRNTPYTQPDVLHRPRINPGGRIDVTTSESNTFAAIATMNIGAVKVVAVGASHNHCDRFHLKDLNVTTGPIVAGTDMLQSLSMPLANSEKCLMDQLFIATYARFPSESNACLVNNDTIINKYPLSTLYQEWKRDKAAGRLHRRTPLDEAMETIRALQAELSLAHIARSASEAHSEKLRAALHAAAENPV